MKRLRLSGMTGRVIGLCALFIVTASCTGKDQLHGMYDLSFSATAVCLAKKQTINFRNNGGQEIVIQGARISYGTDPLGNFYLESLLIDDVETPSVSGTLSDIHIPSGSTYSFKVRYTPKTENVSHSAILDIAYKSPREGIIQIALEGSSTAKSASACVSTDESAGPVDIDGDYNFVVKKMVAATSLIGGTIDTSQGVTEFQPINLPIHFDQAAKKITIAALSGNDFQLPPPGLNAPPDIQGAGILNPTIVQIAAEATGDYLSDDGSLTVKNVQVRMSGDFQADLNIDLTTETVKNNLSPQVRPDALGLLGSLWDSTAGELKGQAIKASDGNSVILVGIAKPTNVKASGTLSTLKGNTMAAVIYGNLVKVE